MTEIRDDPIIRCMERTGYPPWFRRGRDDFEDERDAALKLHLDCGFKEVRREGDVIHLLITSEDYFGK